MALLHHPHPGKWSWYHTVQPNRPSLSPVAASSDHHQGDKSYTRISWYGDQDGNGAMCFRFKSSLCPLVCGLGETLHFLGSCFPPPLPSPTTPRVSLDHFLLSGDPPFWKERFLKVSQFPGLEGKCPSHRDLWGLAALGGALLLENEL